MMVSHRHTVVYGPVKYGPVKKDRLGSCLVVDPMPAESAPDGAVETPAGLPVGDLPHPIDVVVTGGRPPSGGVVVTSVARRMIEMSRGGEKLETVALLGNVDPTTHPNFKEIAENLRELRDKWFAKARLTLFTTPLHLDDPEVRHAVAIFDRPIVRFEWGTAKTFASMTGAPSTRLKDVMSNLSSLDRLIVQATFRKGTQDNSAANEVRGWLKRVDELRPNEIHLSTVESSRKRGAPKPVPSSFLEGLAEQVREKTGVPTQILDQEVQVA